MTEDPLQRIRSASAVREAAPPNTGQPPRPGGPQTADGKLVSRRNALNHGLTATRLLPVVLQPGRLEALLRQFRQEFHPATPTQDVLVAELARHAALLELGQEAEWAVLRQGAHQLGGITLDVTQSPNDHDEAMLAAAVSTEPLDLLSRYRRAHKKAFLAALGKLRELRADRRSVRPGHPKANPPPFATEAECARHLENRFRRRNFRCPCCGHAGGSWLASRARWLCTTCRRQLGLRAGTVMAGSRLPLVKWFRAIRAIVLEPQISPAELSDKTRIKRAATARHIAAKIRAALASADSTQLLADLDNYFLNTSRSS